MNILFLSLGVYDSLENRSIYTDLLKEFKDNGHDIFIVTPRERKMNEETTLENVDGTSFLKVRVGNIRNVNLIEKGISTITLENKFLKAIKKYFKEIKFDLVLYATPPITFSKVVEYIKKRDKATTYLMLKDIFPQNSVDLGMIRNDSFIYHYFRKKEKNLYRISDFIGCMSEANKEYIIKHNSKNIKKKLEVLPNTITPNLIDKNNIENKEILAKYGIPTDKVIYVYGGNLGKPQGIDFLIECLHVNEYNDDTFFLIVGNGTEYDKLNNYFTSHQLKNSLLIKRLPKAEYENLIKSCDVGLIFLDYNFTIPNFPSRLLSYMDVGIPVIAATDSSTDIGKIIEDGNFGISCLSNDVESFNQAVKNLRNKNLRKNMGKNARDFLLKNYTSANSYRILMKHFN